jgi:hypothetical protein
MKAHRGAAVDIDTLLLNLGTRRKHVVNFTPRPLYAGERTPVPIAHVARWAPATVWTF